MCRRPFINKKGESEDSPSLPHYAHGKVLTGDSTCDIILDEIDQVQKNLICFIFGGSGFCTAFAVVATLCSVVCAGVG